MTRCPASYGRFRAHREIGVGVEILAQRASVSKRYLEFVNIEAVEALLAEKRHAMAFGFVVRERPLDIRLVRGLALLLALHELGGEASIERRHFPATLAVERVDARYALIGELGPDSVGPPELASYHGLPAASCRHATAHPQGLDGAQAVDPSESIQVPFDDLVDLDGLIGGLESRRSGRAQNRQDQTSKQHESHLQSGFRTGKALPLETSAPGVFAAGDIRAGAMNRVASAMGEGSMVVRFVHEYLALT